MDDGALANALDRADRALERIEHALAATRASTGRDDRLRARVHEAVAELDRLIRSAEG